MNLEKQSGDKKHENTGTLLTTPTEIQEEQKVLNEVIAKEGINTKDFVSNQEVKTEAQIKASSTASCHNQLQIRCRLKRPGVWLFL